MFKSGLSFLIVMIWISVATAQTTSVLLFPSGAIITEKATLKINAGEALLTLPAAADPESLQITPEGQIELLGYQIETMLSSATEISRLEQLLNERKMTRQELEDQWQINKSGLDYWQNQKNQHLETSEEIQALGKMIVAASTPLRQQLSRLDRERKRLDEEIKELEQQLVRQQGHGSRLWKVTVQTTASSATELVMSYSYRVRQASWSSLYTLEALPGENRVQWRWQAALQQATGQDWNDVELSLATTEPRMTLTPPDIHPWTIRQERNMPVAQEVSRMMSKSAMGMDTELAAAPQELVPQRDEGLLFDTYRLGRVTVKAGKSQTLPIDSGSWPAEFSYLLRPHFSSQAFLTAAITPEDPAPLPTGTAALLVDGVMIGKRSFSLQGSEQNISFGSDPGIVTKISREDLADSSGLFNKNRTLAWKLAVAMTNTKEHAVDITIEDAYPRVSDARIKLQPLELEGQAEPNRTEDRITWTYVLKAGEAASLEYGYRISYPEEMRVEIGR